MPVFNAPANGNFIWARFAETPDSATLLEPARKAGIMLAAGAVFRPNLEPTAYMRFNVAWCDDPRFVRYLAEHAGTTSEALDAATGYERAGSRSDLRTSTAEAPAPESSTIKGSISRSISESPALRKSAPIPYDRIEQRVNVRRPTAAVATQHRGTAQLVEHLPPTRRPIVPSHDENSAGCA